MTPTTRQGGGGWAGGGAAVGRARAAIGQAATRRGRVRGVLLQLRVHHVNQPVLHQHTLLVESLLQVGALSFDDHLGALADGALLLRLPN